MVASLHTAAEILQELRLFLDSRPRKPLIVILGPTASGKTALSIRIAKQLRDGDLSAEIINADSRQLYRHLDIGTAKPSAQEMKGIPHHLFSVLDPKEPCTIAWYQREALQVIDEIHARKNIPLLVGGSMLYVSSVIDGLQPLPPSDPTLRKRLSDAYDLDGGEALHAKLTSVDPVSAAGIPRQNKAYVIRALEIFESSGKPKSTQKRRDHCPYDLFIIGLSVPKAELDRRIVLRTEQMFDAGWAEEVRRLSALDYTSADPGMISTGYRDIIRALNDGTDPRLLTTDIAKQTRQYAKRQMTWWRRDLRIRWITILCND